MRTIQYGLTIFSLLLVGAQCSSPMLLVDSSSGSYLQSSDTMVNVDGKSLASLISALTGLMPDFVNEDAASAIEQVVKPNPLRKPRAHMVFNIAGLSQDLLSEVFDGKQIREIQLIGGDDSSPAIIVVDSLSLIADINPGVSISMLDHQGFEGCDGNCLDEHMPAAADCMQASHEDSILTFSSGASLDLNRLSDKMFAIEAASLYGGMQAQMRQASSGLEQDLHLLETTLVGLHGLEAAHGADSEVVVSARKAVRDLIKWAVKSLDESYAGDVTYQVTGFPGAPKKTTVQEIMGWKQDARRSLLMTSTLGELTATGTNSTNGTVYPPTDQEAAAKLFTAKACGYGGFILTLYFGMAAIWCMCYMPMKQDTMLFGAKKQE